MMDQNYYTTIVRNIGKELILDYINNDKILGGLNGPYDDPETPVRNLCHLIIITSLEIKIFNNSKYIDILEKMSRELCGLQSEDGLFIMRLKKEKDLCNGVIGHSWVIEALLYLHMVFKEEKYLNMAAQIASKHSRVERLNLWAIPNKVPTDLTIDYTFNHQLWYAASLAELNNVLKNTIFQQQLDCFILSLDLNMTNSGYGKIAHTIYRRLGKIATIKSCVKRMINLTNDFLSRKSMAYKEEGYHVFNLMALARISNVYPNYKLECNKKIIKALQYVNTDSFFKGLNNPMYHLDQSLHNDLSDSETQFNIYGYPYNVPAFELCYISKIYKGIISPNVVERCLCEQWAKTYNMKVNRLSNNVHDVCTINYRIYEYYRYLEINHE